MQSGHHRKTINNAAAVYPRLLSECRFPAAPLLAVTLAFRSRATGETVLFAVHKPHGSSVPFRAARSPSVLQGD